MFANLNITWVREPQKESIGLPDSPAAMTAIAKMTEKVTTWSTSLCAIASMRLVGKMCRSVSTSVSGFVWAAAPSEEASLASRTPTPGLMMLTTVSPTTSAADVTTSKYRSVFAPIRPTFFMSPVPAMPWTMLPSTSGAIITLMRLRKMSRTRLSHWLQAARWPSGSPIIHHPTRHPSTSPIMIWRVSDRWCQGFRADPGASGLEETIRHLSQQAGRTPSPKTRGPRPKWFDSPLREAFPVRVTPHLACCAFALLAATLCRGAEPVPIRLWPGIAPGDKGDLPPEKDTTGPKGDLVHHADLPGPCRCRRR